MQTHISRYYLKSAAEQACLSKSCAAHTITRASPQLLGSCSQQCLLAVQAITCSQQLRSANHSIHTVEARAVPQPEPQLLVLPIAGWQQMSTPCRVKASCFARTVEITTSTNCRNSDHLAVTSLARSTRQQMLHKHRYPLQECTATLRLAVLGSNLLPTAYMM
jgi:hypothetical protein